MLKIQLYSDATNLFTLEEITTDDIDALKTQENCSICLDTLQDKTYQITKTNPCPKSHYFHFNCLQQYALSVLKFNKKFTCGICRTDLLKMGNALKSFEINPNKDTTKANEWFFVGKQELEKSHTFPTCINNAVNFLRMSVNGGCSEAKPFLAEAELLDGKQCLEEARTVPVLIDAAVNALTRSLNGGCSKAKPFLAEAELLDGKQCLEKARTDPVPILIDAAVNTLTRSLNGGCSKAKPFLAEAELLDGKLCLEEARTDPVPILIDAAVSVLTSSLNRGCSEAKPFLAEAELLKKMHG